MLYSLLTPLYRRWHLRSLSAKLLVPIVGLMLLSLLGSSLAFVAGTALTQNQILRQQTGAEAERVTQALAARQQAVSTAADLLAGDPQLVDALRDDSVDLNALNARTVVVRERFGLDLVQVYDGHGQARANLVLSSLYRESSLLEHAPLGTPAVQVVEGRALLLARSEIGWGKGSVVTGIDLESELQRIASEYRLSSDLGLSVGDFHTGTRADLPFDAPDGRSQDHYGQRISLLLGRTPVDLLLVRPTTDIVRVATTGLLVMVGSALFTLLLLTGLSVLVARSIARPIQQLSHAAEGLSRGDLSHRVDLDISSSPLAIGHEDEIGLLAGTFNTMVAELRGLYDGLEAKVQARTHELATAAEVARTVSASLDLEVVLQSSVQLIAQRLKFYHIAIFLVERGSNMAVLQTGTGQAGQLLKQQGFRVPIGSRSLVSMAADTHCARVVQDVDKDPLYLRNTLLPHTRSEAAIPLVIGQQVVGVLDVQSTEKDTFTPPLVQLLAAVADQIAIGVQNAQTYARQRRTAERLMEVDKLKDQFLSHMSHELRTPLNSIIGFSQILLKGLDGPLNDAQLQDAETIHSAGKHLLALVNDVLDITRINAGKIELSLGEVDMEALVESALGTSEALFKDKPITLRSEIAPGLPAVRADKRRVNQVLLNLLSNAAKFTAAGQVTIRAQVTEIVVPGTARPEPAVRVSVSDTGIGIPADRLSDIFREFVQVDISDTRRFAGSGLGLPISKKLVEMHGGQIWVESKADQGSTFTFALPVRGPQTAGSTSKQERGEQEEEPEVLAIPTEVSL